MSLLPINSNEQQTYSQLSQPLILPPASAYTPSWKRTLYKSVTWSLAATSTGVLLFSGYNLYHFTQSESLQNALDSGVGGIVFLITGLASICMWRNNPYIILDEANKRLDSIENSLYSTGGQLNQGTERLAKNTGSLTRSNQILTNTLNCSISTIQEIGQEFKGFNKNQALGYQSICEAREKVGELTVDIKHIDEETTRLVEKNLSSSPTRYSEPNDCLSPDMQGIANYYQQIQGG